VASQTELPPARRWLLPFALGCAALLGLPAPALAEPFAGQHVLAGRGLELPNAERQWQVQMHTQVTAARAILRRAVQTQVDTFVRAHPEAADYERYLTDPRAMRALELLDGGDLDAIKRELRTALADNGTLGPDAERVIAGIRPEDVRTLDAWLEIRNSERASVVVSVEPSLAWTSRHVRLAARLPVAWQHVNGNSTFRHGNLGLDARTGMHGSSTVAGSLGLTLWLPTASRGQGEPRRAALLSTAGLGGRWLGVAPHTQVGLDLGWFELIGRGELTLLASAQGGAPLRQGLLGTAMVLDLPGIALAVEADRLHDLGGAAAADGVWLLGAAVRAQPGKVRLALGARMPIAPDDAEAFAGIGGPWAQPLADLGVTLDIGAAW